MSAPNRAGRALLRASDPDGFMPISSSPIRARGADLHDNR